ncbi:MAG TPA: endonuclease/exonuclease/phosphatase family protein [Flavobacterium sp.]|uniref:Endonuclease/exonuclease/phosphatase family metal-dependent hydrolase n=1 Tax=Flavobacterium dankookense TaxID=706186 RepID=A0A4R6QET4_9FLAO|nr:endonuclease/exonuclease/phosphatase family protein [Flavobacterium dankookense]TDP60757.1 endonuclease/exonuclease/phosphatase family metal-dependent hydrolase [Flavobacterium dankookense]HOD09398.1 endonuclease/exonuclease/phosphatase family protein [Flavobacterium sp.]
MKKLSWFNKVVYGFNIMLILLTIIAYVLPFLAPKAFPLLSVLTLILPLFLLLNALFFIYWLLQLKRQLIFSGIILLLGITFINKFYKFSSNEVKTEEKDFTVMSYNVRLFNLFEWIEDDTVGDQILSFVNEKNPDILCVQEYSENANIDLRVYKYKAVFMEGNKIKTGQAIFSKFPIFNQGNLQIKDIGNNITFADIKKGKDTIRVYNIHLQSIKISPDVNEISEHVETINKNKSQQVFTRIRDAFKKQEQQAEVLVNHRKECNYPIIIAGDMNNSAFSYVYRSIKGNLNDCFEEAGKGFGQTYKFKYYPARIDYIFADKRMKVKSFTNFSEFQNSDHFPVMARVSFVE